MINCPADGWVVVPEKDLPVLLPNISDYKPEGTGKGPLANHKEFYETKCPKCGGKATRETDVMDTFVDSSWYFLRYPSVGVENKPFDLDLYKKWLPVSLYFGGAEHSVLHLMYARFVTMVLHDLKLIDFDEPFPKFFAHGLMIKDGAKMSKSRGNVVNPDDYVAKFGADALRLYLAFMGPMDAYPDFRDSGMEGASRFLRRVLKLFNKGFTEKSSPEALTKLHQTIKGVTDDVLQFKYNTAIAKIMEFVNLIEDQKVDKETLKVLALLLAPFAPHMTEEIWVEILGEHFSIHKASWPHYNAKYAQNKTLAIVIQVNGKMRSVINVDAETAKDKKKILEMAKENEKVVKWLKGSKIKKEIFVDGKLVNFVVQ